MRLSPAFKTSLVIVLTLLVQSCTTINPYTGQQQTSRAVQYGAIGAVVCGLIGASESGQRARNAAAGCGAIGAGVGAYMDVQEAELREELQGTGVQVIRDGDRLDLIMPGNVTFDSNEYTIRSEFYPVLDSVSTILYKYTDTQLQINGHTDSTGALDFNYSLSDRRASSVASYLSSRGVDQSRVFTRGLGPDQPIANNDTPSGRASNRRVELQIVAVQS
ncbi:MAG: OmpA family protein [Gammaproteobacteria bacterium]|jgi:outer membrane protein OmpA-like peptidoglycan-associated protein|nr:OmpA family protein [Gammaproteobacteria bacterium]MBT3859353.1 OmpA family protein [Gammaproteobacteria bacterium]MBT3986878.1 OmpA family protein [Gammaproteobacteria bacterium]MBT4255813.1 OmpA family protein [Gammaproteobacteria bacterium]MBT4581933.1 OmpA family protein [Gammaproteobacteria bacterium]